ncbi:copper-binding protein [Permianibacter sp. IMCC34836]|nr:copper-binding protein [Permianibacter fluminis]
MKLGLVFVGVLLNVGGATFAHEGEHGQPASVETPAMNTAAALTEGEVRKLDKEAGKVTLKHAEIKNLDMPGMTMVFQVKDKAQLAALQVGDKVQFQAISDAGKIVITEIHVVK